MYQVSRIVLVLTALCATGACGEPASRPQQDRAPAAAKPVVQSSPHRATLGSLSYTFDAKALTLTDVSLALPPKYEDEVFASKLIPAERAAMLGEEACTYGESGLATTCTAGQEAGLSLALLERPLDEYRQAFAEDGIAEEELSATALDGATGFAFTAGAEGSGIEYHFLPLDERTLLIARQFALGHEEGSAAIKEVIAGIAREMEDEDEA